MSTGSHRHSVRRGARNTEHAAGRCSVQRVQRVQRRGTSRTVLLLNTRDHCRERRSGSSIPADHCKVFKNISVEPERPAETGVPVRRRESESEAPDGGEQVGATRLSSYEYLVHASLDMPHDMPTARVRVRVKQKHTQLQYSIRTSRPCAVRWRGVRSGHIMGHIQLQCNGNIQYSYPTELELDTL